LKHSMLLWRSLAFHWRPHLAVALGAATATATLTGALLVGDSMRASLREVALGRLGRVELALVAPRFFRTVLATELANDAESSAAVAQICPAILLRGGASHAGTGARAEDIAVLGVDEAFWRLDVRDQPLVSAMPDGRAVILNRPLADDLGAQAGDDVLVRVGRPAAISTETLLGRRDDTTLTLRLTVDRVVPAEGIGAFALSPRHVSPRNAWVPLAVLQGALKKPDRVNALLVAAGPPGSTQGERATEAIRSALQRHVTAADLGLKVRVDAARGYVSLESESLLIEPLIEEAALDAAGRIGAAAASILTYLANSLELDAPAPEDPGDSGTARPAIPYSTVTAVPPSIAGVTPLTLSDGEPAPPLGDGDILLNEWAANDLGAGPGGRVRLTYYVTDPFGRLDTQSHSFAGRGVVRLDDAAADGGFTPEYEGITDTHSLADWDPPFPIDLSKVRKKDDDYWERYRAAPKAFISLADGVRLWAHQEGRFGRSTAIRVAPATGADLVATADAFRDALLRELEVARLGLAFDRVRERLSAASEGTTDFGMLFIGFSFFLIVSAAMLVALFFRLGAERRAHEIGLMLATGFPSSKILRLLLAEGGLIAAMGGAVGLLAAMGYAWLMLRGLRTWWADAANVPFLQLHVDGVSFIVGYLASLAIAVVSIAYSIRGLTRVSARGLLAGWTRADPHLARRRNARRSRVIAGTFLAIAVALSAVSALTDAVPEAAAFFGSGAALLIACLGFLSGRLGAEYRSVIHRGTTAPLARFGVRNAGRFAGRSLLTAGLIASATFVIASLQAFRLEADDGSSNSSGTGGFALMAESAVPLPYDLSTAAGRSSLGVADEAGVLQAMQAIPFRLRPGDESSCLNLYRPTRPRILGAGREMIERGGFVFSSTLAESEEEEHNPWMLLDRIFPDGAVPVIGDESAVRWQLHLGLGQDLTVTDGRGEDVRLRFVALLSGSVLQDELIVSEAEFVKVFPAVSGRAFFLIETPRELAGEIELALERELGMFSLNADSTTERLAEFLAVQNTYLSTFQTLGGLGLVLGSVGLAVVLLRNVEERRGELALMRALGFSRGALGWVVLSENLALVAAGLVAGVLPALLAIAPHLAARPASLPWLSLAVTLAGVFVAGVGAGVVALVPTLRAPLLPALRRE